MQIKKILENNNIKLLSQDISNDDIDLNLKGVFCCDLLSIAMSKASKDYAWVTIMANVNTVAVASLAEIKCIFLAEDVLPVDQMLKKATENDILVFKSSLPIFETAQFINSLIERNQS